MRKLKIYLSNLTYNTLSIATDAFPLNVGYVASYCKKKFGDKVDITLFKYVEELDKKIHDDPPDILGMSNYIWNYNLGREFFKMMSTINKNTILVWGGPNFPLDWPSQKEFMKNHPEFDIYVPIRGEIGFSEIVKKVLTKENYEKNQILNDLIPGCITRDSAGKIHFAFENEQVKELDDIPSPYTTGIMDKFFDGKLNPLIQTSRGCPFSCTFCTDGSDLVRKVSKFSQEYIDEELQYIGKHVPNTVHTLHIADLNFGMLPGDLETCKSIKNLQEEYGFPKHIFATTGKNRKEQIIDAIQLLEGTMALSMSVQSMDKQVLQNIRRDNISEEKMLELAPTIKKTGLLTKAEVILGLPGESYQSHIETIRKLVSTNMDDITVHTCILLHGSEMNTPEERKKWDFKTKFRIVQRDFGELSNGRKVCEYEEVIVGSNTLTFDEYLKLRLLAFVLWVNTKGVIYVPLIKFLIENNIDVFELHHKMVENRHNASTKIMDVFERFKKASTEELFDSPEEILTEIQEKSIYQKLLDEEIGINVVHSYHAYVLFEMVEDWSKYIIKTAYDLMKEKLEKSELIKEQFNEIANYTIGSSHNPLGKDSINTNPEFEFNYDIKKWVEEILPKKLSEFKFSNTQKIKFKLSEEQYKTVQDTIQRYGNTMSGRGLAIKNVSMIDLWRTPHIQ